MREAPDDWLNAGARAGLVEEVGRRSFQRHGTGWLRCPTLDEIAGVSTPDETAEIFPSVDVHDRLDVPATMVLAGNGFYAGRRDEVAALVAADPRRTLVEVDANHNVPMTAPGVLARFVLDAASGGRVDA